MYTTNEVAEGFGVTRQTIQNWVEAGRLAYSSKRNLRGDRLFDPEKINEFAQAHDMIFKPKTAQPNN